MYSQKVINLFQHPENVGVLRGANGVGMVVDPVCGDTTKLYILIENDVIVDAKFKVFGCVASIAVAVALTNMIKGMSVKDAYNISDINILSDIDGLPTEKQHCAVLICECLDRAIQDYNKKMEKANDKN